MTLTKNYTQTTKIFEKTIEHDGQDYTLYVKLVERNSHKTACVYLGTEEMNNGYGTQYLYWAKMQMFNEEYNGTQWAPYGLNYNDDEAIAKTMMELVEKEMEETLKNMRVSWNYKDSNIVDIDILDE